MALKSTQIWANTDPSSRQKIPSAAVEALVWELNHQMGQSTTNPYKNE